MSFCDDKLIDSRVNDMGLSSQKQSKDIQPIGILFHENGKHHRESQHARPTITQERQWYADDGYQTDGHADVDGKMHEDDACDAIAVHAAEGRSLSFGKDDDAHQ